MRVDVNVCNADYVPESVQDQKILSFSQFILEYDKSYPTEE